MLPVYFLLWTIFISHFQDVMDTLPKDPKEIQQPLQLIDLMNERATSIIETLGGPDKYLEVLDEISVDKVNFKHGTHCSL